jgi:two-component system, OmpR family, response regulator CpxR
MTRVLVIDDDRNECRMLEGHLAREGMAAQFAYDGKAGLESALSGDHDFVIVDLTLPQVTGLEVIRQLRIHSSIGIVILSDPSNDVDKIIGLECGADDCMARPYNPRELASRIRAISRRRAPWLAPHAAFAPEYLNVGDLTLDGGSRTCRRNAELIELTTAEYDLLSTFLRSSGRAIHRKDLLKRVLGREYNPFDRNIDVHVCNLRRKLGPLPDGTERIRGVRNIGYLYARPSTSESITS